MNEWKNIIHYFIQSEMLLQNVNLQLPWLLRVMIMHWRTSNIPPWKTLSYSGFYLQYIQFCVSVSPPAVRNERRPVTSSHLVWAQRNGVASPHRHLSDGCSLAPVLSLNVSPRGRATKVLMIPFWSAPLWFGWPASADDKWLCHGGTCWESERFIPASVSQALFFPGAFPTFL